MEGSGQGLVMKRINLLKASIALIKISHLICCANQSTDFYIRATQALIGLTKN